MFKLVSLLSAKVIKFNAIKVYERDNVENETQRMANKWREKLIVIMSKWIKAFKLFEWHLKILANGLTTRL